jgi:putative DNA primase/helicase
MNPERIPAELRALPQWLCWRRELRAGKPTKVPVDSHTGGPASSADPATWSRFDDAVAAMARYGCDGVGFVFSEADPYAGIDLDDCIGEDDELGDVARRIVEEFTTYTEVSPSGEGLHCILRGRVPLGARKQAVLDAQKVEVYSQGRFFCMTGASVGANEAAIGDRQPELGGLCARLKAAACADADSGRKLREGEGRNNELTRRLGLEVAEGVTGAELRRRAHELNDFDPPLPDDEVEKILRSAAQWPTGEGPFVAHHCTDTGNAERLIDYCGERVRYCAPDSTWYIHNGARWVQDKTLRIEDLAGEALLGIYNEAGVEGDRDSRRELRQWAASSEALAKRRAAVEIARSDRRVAVEPGDFDRDDWRFNCLNGTLDLHNGRLSPHDPADLISKLAPVTHDPHARSALWERVLGEATGGDKHYLDHMQRFLGACLTADTTAELFAVAIGETETSKSTVLGAVRKVMGDYAADVAPETFCTRSRVGGTRDNLLRLAGVRLALIPEADKRRHLDEAMLKRFVSGEGWPERGVYQRERDLRPVAKVVFHTNEMPQMSDADDAVWRRALSWPFDHRPKVIDETIKPALLDLSVSGPAILAWLVQGCLAWQRDGGGKAGLGKSTTVDQAKSALRESMNPLADFFEERCTFAPAWTDNADLRDALAKWCKDYRLEMPTSKALSAALTKKGCTPEKRRHARGWRGVSLVGATSVEVPFEPGGTDGDR